MQQILKHCPHYAAKPFHDINVFAPMRFSSFFIYLFSVLFPLHCVFLVDSSAAESSPFYQIEIEPLFHDLLVSHQDFMAEGGTLLFEDENGDLALIGIGKVFPEQTKNESIASLSRKGEIRARAAILEMGGDVEIQTFRGNSDSIAIGQRAASLSSFFQATSTKVEDKIQQLPVVGTWWSNDKGIFYVAVGKMVQGGHQAIDQHDKETLPVKLDLHNLAGDEPFISLIKLSPLLQQSGGIKVFQLGDDRKVLISVASAPVTNSIASTHKIARLKAIRSLLGKKRGISMSSAEYLSDMEHIQITKEGEQHVLLSDFLSVQKEHVAGEINALPVVASWEDLEEQILYVAIGKIR